MAPAGHHNKGRDVKERTNVPNWLAIIFVTALLSLQAWELTEISALKVSVAALAAEVNLAILRTAK